MEVRRRYGLLKSQTVGVQQKLLGASPSHARLKQHWCAFWSTSQPT
jgi:hypothetical protein